MKIRLATLGPLTAYRGEEEDPVLLRWKRRLGLIIYLALEGDATRDQLLNLLWPEKDPERARHALTQAIYEIRRECGAGCLESHGEWLRCGRDLEVDASAFQAAFEAGDHRGALELYRGAFLEGTSLVQTPDYQHWVDQSRARLQRIHRLARQKTLEAAMVGGDLPSALGTARRWVELDAVDDEAQHWYIKLLALSGRRTEAVRQYEAFRRLLAQDELEPLPQTRELHDSIRDGLDVGPIAEPDIREFTRPTRHSDTAAGGGVPPPEEEADRQPWILAWASAIKQRWFFRTALGSAATLFVLLQIGEIYGWGQTLLYRMTLVGLCSMAFLLTLSWALEHRFRASGSDSFPSLFGLLSWRGSVVGLVGVLAVLVPIWIWPGDLGAPGSGSNSPPVPTRYPLAVLPILPADTSDRELRDFADRLTTLLIDHVKSFRRLQVRPEREVWRYRDRGDPPLSVISRELGVHHMITGQVERVGSRIRLSLALSDSLQQLWGGPFFLEGTEADGDPSALEAVLPKLTESLRLTLGTTLSAREVRLGSENPEAVRLVLEGRVQKASGAAPERAGGFETAEWLLSQADSLFREASRLDPAWAEPHLQRADVSELRASVGKLAEVFRQPGSLSARERQEVLEAGVGQVDRALELSPGDPKAFEKRGILRLALVGLGTPKTSEEEAELQELARQDFHRSIAADPFSPMAHAELSILYFGWGDFASARDEGELAYSQNVFMEELPTLLSNLAMSDFELGDDEEASRRCREGLDRYGDAQARVVFVECEITLLAFDEAMDPDPDRAWELILSEDGSIRPENRDPRTGDLNRSLGMLLSGILVRRGLPDSARAVMDRVREAPSNLKNRVTEAAVLTEMGDTLQALRILEECIQGQGQSPRVLLGTRRLRPLWDYPGFQALASRAGVVVGRD